MHNIARGHVGILCYKNPKLQLKWFLRRDIKNRIYDKSVFFFLLSPPLRKNSAGVHVA